MIKLFRNIRKQLLKQGKTNNYLKYAIGEIVLVVIGILIALQINNWNSHRIQNNKENVYVENIKRDLTVQLGLIDAQLSYENQILNSATPLIKSYKQKQKFEVDSIFTRNLGKLSGRMTFIKHNPTFTELISTGNLDIFQNQEFKNNLIEFNQGIERTELVLNKNNDYIDKIFIPDVLKITETQLSSIFDMESFQDTFGGNEEVLASYGMDLNEAHLRQISQKLLENKSNELILANQINYRYRIAQVNYLFLLKQKQKLQYLLTQAKNK
ncbi:DUF6090 family protein [Yeosuana sp. AK3]